MTNTKPTPLTLIILDGWGYREQTESNAIAAAQKPVWDAIWQQYPHTTISGSGKCVGLPDGQMGNSEVGHLNMGAGRIVQQELTRIDSAIENGEFFNNQILRDALSLAQATGKKLHILGLLSPGGVHSHELHIHALLKLAATMHLSDVYLHAFLDGRDTPPQSALASLNTLEAICTQLSCGKIASLIGRYYAMDRDNRWERTQKAYDLLTQDKADYHAETAAAGLALAYARGENDEFVAPTQIGAPVTIYDGDVVIFMNFRADRARQLTEAFINPDFHGFKRDKWPELGRFVCLTQYDKQFLVPIAFAPMPLSHLFAECVSERGLRQLRIAETEKYAHVTFFFNGGIEKPLPLEDRILIPSPKVATYDLAPAMSARELTDKLIEAIESDAYAVIICNFANPDMLGHTGNFAATVQAIEIIDECLGKIIAASNKTGGEILITADHGNAELMYDNKTKQPHTAHTSDPVPFIYLGRPAKIDKENGKLSDIAPTMLYLMGIEQPTDMTGNSLVKLQ
jgi:2,3-bisphosphoglycerate-independent phosphoglycerate mutase